MDAGIIKSIEVKRNALYKHYDLPEDARRKAEALFTRMEQFGNKCRNQADFEEKFANQTMSREYYGLLVEFTAYLKTPTHVPVYRHNTPIYPTTGQQTVSQIRKTVINAMRKLFGKKSN